MTKLSWWDMPFTNAWIWGVNQGLNPVFNSNWRDVGQGYRTEGHGTVAIPVPSNSSFIIVVGYPLAKQWNTAATPDLAQPYAVTLTPAPPGGASNSTPVGVGFAGDRILFAAPLDPSVEHKVTIEALGSLLDIDSIYCMNADFNNRRALDLHISGVPQTTEDGTREAREASQRRTSAIVGALVGLTPSVADGSAVVSQRCLFSASRSGGTGRSAGAIWSPRPTWTTDARCSGRTLPGRG
jgi:hypothetical protein